MPVKSVFGLEAMRFAAFAAGGFGRTAGLDDDRGLGSLARRQRRNRVHHAVLFAQFFDVAEVQSALGAAFHAHRHAAFLRALKAAVALAHLHGLLVELRHAVGAGLGAHAAADALGRVDDNQAVLGPLEMRAGRADLDAGGIGAFVAAHRDVVGVLTQGAVPILAPRASFVLNDAAQIQADGHVFEVCAGNRAGAAASTAAHVNEKTFL